MLSREGNETGAPNDGLLKSRENDHSLLLNTLKTPFAAIYKVLLAQKKCILSGAINWYLSVRPF